MTMMVLFSIRTLAIFPFLPPLKDFVGLSIRVSFVRSRPSRRPNKSRPETRFFIPDKASRVRSSSILAFSVGDRSFWQIVLFRDTSSLFDVKS